MEKKPELQSRSQILKITIGAIIVVLLINIGLGFFLMQQKAAKGNVTKPLVTAAVQLKVTNSFSYKGEEGKDALTLLKQKGKPIEQNSTGLVTAIKGRKVQEKKKEFWAFYINGKFAEVGPAEYITHDGDKITWKIQNY